MSNNNNSNQPRPAPGTNFLIPTTSVMTNANNGVVPPPQQLQMMAPTQLSQQQQAAWMSAAAAANNHHHHHRPPATAASVMNMNIANMNPQQQQALAALQQQVMFRNNAANNNGAMMNNNHAAPNVAATVAAVTAAANHQHRPAALTVNPQQQQVAVHQSSTQGGMSVRHQQHAQQQQGQLQQRQQQQQQQQRGASSSINPMNLTPKQQQQLQHHQKSQMIHLQQQLNAQKPTPIMAAMAAAAAAQAQAQGQQQGQGGQQQQQQQVSSQQQPGGDVQHQVAQAYVQAVSQAPGANVQQQNVQQQQQQQQQRWNGQVVQQSQGMAPPQQQQQQQQGQQQQMMPTPSPGTPKSNNSQGVDTNNQVPQQQQQQQQGNIQQQTNQQQIQMNQQQLHQQQIQMNQNQQQLSQNQQQLNMMRHNVQQEQLKHFHMQATVQNGQQASNVQQQTQQQQQQLIRQPQNPQQVINQLQAFQVQRLRFLQNQQGQVQQGQVMPQNTQQGQVMQQNAQQGQVMQQQQQQLRSSFQLDALGVGRPPSAMHQSASPMRPPSAQPASRQTSFNLSNLSVADQQGQVIRQGFYKPLKTSMGSSRGGDASSQSAGSPATSMPGGTGSLQSSIGQQQSSQTNEAFAGQSASQPNPTLNQSILNQYLPMAPPTLNNTAVGTQSDVERRPSQSHKFSSSHAAPTSSSGKTSTPRQHPHESTLSHDEVKKLASQLSCEEKVVWVSKQILGTHGSNGFQKAMSNVQKTKRQRLRQYKKQHQDDAEIDTDDLDRVKVKTMNVRVAEQMIADMNQGLQFCDLMADTIMSILKEIDPNNPLISACAAPSLLGIQQNPRVADTMAAMHAISSAVSASLQEPNKGGGGGGRGDGGSSTQMVRPPNTGHGAETVAQGNPQGSTLRKSRKRSSTKFLGDRDLVAVIGDHDDNGKKLTKKELNSRLFEATRFRTLNEGDYVAAKVNSQNLWILARVVQQWNEVKVPLKEILDMSDIKREALFNEKVFIQMNDEYNGDLSNARAVKRQHILPLARSHMEGNDWGKRLRKGSRVYAIYPKTITFYCATVIDCTTYCRNQDDVIVVEFDGDEDDNGKVPQRHIPARFVTLVPREFETNKRRRKSSSDAARRRSSKLVAASSSTAPPLVHQADMLAEMLYDPPTGFNNA